MCRPRPKRPQGSREETKAKRQRQRVNQSAESDRHQLLRRRPSSDRQSGARSGGPCRSVGGPVSGARRISPASQSEPAGICPAPFVPGFPPLRGGNVRRTKGARGCRAKGRETCVEPTYTFSCPPQEVGYSASEARKADPRKAANSERRPQSSSRLPCPRSGDASRAGKRKLAVCNTLCAASDPSPGSTFSATRRGDGEGRSRGPGRGRRSRRGPVFTGPKTLAAGPSPGKARQQPRKNHRVGAEI